jgi:hypothetical protein
MSEESIHANVLAISNNIEQKKKEKLKAFYNPLYSNHLNPTHQQIHPFACSNTYQLSQKFDIKIVHSSLIFHA